MASMASGDFSIKKRRFKGGIALLEVRGYLDAHTFGDMDAEIQQCFDDGEVKLIIDLAGVDFISSAGAGVFIGAHGDATENGGKIVLMNTTDNVREVFQLLGLTELFDFATDIKSAAKLFR